MSNAGDAKTHTRLSQSPMRELFRYVDRHRRLFVGASFASVTNKVLDLMPPILVGWVIDAVRREPPAWMARVVGTDDPLTLAAFLAILGVGIFALESLFQWMYQYGFMVLAQRVQHGLRVDTYARIQQREMEFFENHRMGETMAMLSDDVNQLERFLNIGFNEIVQLVVLFIFSGAVMFYTSWELACLGLIPIPIILWGSLYYQRLVSPRYRRVREAVGALTSRLENNIAGIQVIKSFTAERYEQERVAQASREYQEANRTAIRLSSLYVPVIRMAVAIGFGSVLLVGSYWVLEDRGVLTVGELVLFSMLIQRVLWPLTRLGTTFDEMERARASARRTFGLLETKSKIQSPSAPISLPRAKGDLAFENVFFRYDQGVEVLRGLSFGIAAGETVGVAGATGAGKSTIIKLLLRLYDPSSGHVRLDGHDLRELDLIQLRRNVALVSQDVYLFHGTVGENIAYGRPEATGAEMQEAARRAQLHDFVSSLPEQYDTLVGERGIKLSGGQRQRLSIARAVLKDAPILILDEATSSVDTETERAIQEHLTEFTEGKTALVIAHRLSTIRQADRILVLKDGVLVEEGQHDSLISANRIYADLWRVQSGQAKAKP